MGAAFTWLDKAQVDRRGCRAIAAILEHEAEYPYPVEAVWEALTDPKPMGLWLMNFDNDEGEMTATFRPVVGAAYRLDARKGRGWRGYVVGTVLEVVPKQRLAYTWAHSASQDANPILVTFTLTPTDRGTRLRMVQSGFGPGIKGWFAMKGAQMGWRKMLGSGLPVVLEGLASPG
jgi:uncharacterized protein YndB with AHSA1/START domain